MKRLGVTVLRDERTKGQVQVKITGCLAPFQPIARHSPAPVPSRRVA
jgi:hypothetical protein